MPTLSITRFGCGKTQGNTKKNTDECEAHDFTRYTMKINSEEATICARSARPD